MNERGSAGVLVMSVLAALAAACGAELEITALEPITLALAPQEEEDWGE